LRRCKNYSAAAIKERMVLTMKKKSVLVTLLALVLTGGIMTACSAANAATQPTPIYETPAIAMTNTAVAQLAHVPPATAPPDTAKYENESNKSAEVITHMQLPASLVDDLARQSDDEQAAFWSDFWQNHPDVYTIEFYDENGVVIWALVTDRSMAEVDNMYLYDLDEALILHRADNLVMPTYLPEGFAFERAWFSGFSCPISNPDAEFAGGQLFVVFSDGEQSLTLEIRYHPEYGGFDVWTSCENLEEMTINGRSAIIGDGGLSVQVTHNVRYTFMTWPFAGAGGSAISNDELVRIAESLQ